MLGRSLVRDPSSLVRSPPTATHLAAQPHEHHVARGALVNVVGHFAGVLDPAMLWVVGLWLGPATLGLVMFVRTLIEIALRIATLGTDRGLLRAVPMADSVAAAHSAIATSLRAVLAASALVAGACFVGADVLVPLVGDADQVGGAFWLRWLVLGLPAEALMFVLLSARRGQHAMADFVAVRTVAVPMVQLGLAVPMLAAGLGAGGVAAAIVAGQAIGLGLAWRRTSQAFEMPLRAVFTAPTAVGLLRYSLPQGLTDVLNHSMGRVDVLMLGAMLPDRPEVVAVYGLASMLAGWLRRVRSAFDLSISPVLSALIASGDRAQLTALYANVTIWVLVCFVVVAGPVALGAEWVFLLYGDGAFAGYSEIVPILVLPRLVNVAGGPAQSALQMAGRSGLELGLTTAGSVTNIGLNLLWIPIWGPWGAAAATALSLVAVNLGRNVLVARLLGLVPPVRRVARVLASAAAAGLAAAAIPWTFGHNAVSSISAATLYVPALVALLVRDARWDDLVRAWRTLASAPPAGADVDD